MVFLTETWLNTDIKDSEIFLGSSFEIISRIDRERGQHGGLLIAQSCNISLRIIDFTIPRFDFAICCAVICDKISFFVLIYNPPASLDYSVDISYLLDCIQAYYTKFNLISDNLNYGLDYTVYFVGNFSFPTIDWTSYYSSSCIERRFLEMVIENDLFQLVCELTHKDNNILDLVLSNVVNLSVSVSKQLFSDHFPVYFYFTSIPVPICPHILFSKSSFNAILFNRNSQQLLNFLSRDSSFSFTYPDDWYSLLVDSFVNSIKIKRAIRKQLALFYSSHTVHLTNQKESTLRKFENDASFLLAIKLRDRNTSLSNSTEMDKEIFVIQFDLSSTRHCFKLLRCLGLSSSIPSVMVLGNESFHTDFDIALAFNRFFASVLAVVSQIVQ